MKKVLLSITFLILVLSAHGQHIKSENDLPTTNCPQEDQPEFPGGEKKFTAFVKQNLRWPKDDGTTVEGRVILTFFIEKDGSLTGIKILRSLSPAYDQEALRLMKKSPKWIPGKQIGKPVRCGYILPIPFHVS
jgi:protein TonB